MPPPTSRIKKMQHYFQPFELIPTYCFLLPHWLQIVHTIPHKKSVLYFTQANEIHNFNTILPSS